MMPIGIIYAQETNCNVSGIVNTSEGVALDGATVNVVHVPTRSVYITRTNTKGYFHIFNLKPGGPYRVSISFVGYRSEELEDLYAEFGSESFQSIMHDREFRVFNLQRDERKLPGIVVSQKRITDQAIGVTTVIPPSIMKDMPSISRNLQDYARLVPNAKVNGSGSMSFAGQSNKFNAFFIDGANSLDLLGVSASGISGGQTSSPPVSMDVIEEIRILSSPSQVFPRLQGRIPCRGSMWVIILEKPVWTERSLAEI